MLTCGLSITTMIEGHNATCSYQSILADGVVSDFSQIRAENGFPKMSPGWPDSSECQANQTENGIHVQFTLAA
jgi:hypothetical protein